MATTTLSTRRVDQCFEVAELRHENRGGERLGWRVTCHYPGCIASQVAHFVAEDRAEDARMRHEHVFGDPRWLVEQRNAATS